jgi:hypothetical protein
LIHHLDVNQAFADGTGHRGAKKKAAMKFQNAAHATARKGVRTRVETTVAIELAASCQPLENSKVSVRTMTRTKR